MSALIIPLPGLEKGQEVRDADTSDGDVKALTMELRRARIRIAQLEASLTEVMRDNLANYNRARDAERELERIRS